jgi:hypothetical protein
MRYVLSESKYSNINDRRKRNFAELDMEFIAQEAISVEKGNNKGHKRMNAISSDDKIEKMSSGFKDELEIYMSQNKFSSNQELNKVLDENAPQSHAERLLSNNSETRQR